MSEEKTVGEGLSSSNDWQCAVCMSAYVKPKLLPCSHTFCQQCLEGIVYSLPSHNSHRFPCPMCREMINVPDDGVASFKNNIYIFENRSNIFCENHPKAERHLIDLNCLQCNVLLCWKCKSNYHINHLTEELAVTAGREKTKLVGINDALKSEIEDLTKIQKCFEKELEDIKKKGKAIKHSIKKKCSLLKDMVDELQREALFSLDMATVSIKSQLSTDNLERVVTDLERLQKRMDACISGKDVVQLLVTGPRIISEIEAEGVFVRKVRADSTAAGQLVSRPTLNFSGSSDMVVDICRNFVGTVVRKDLPVAPPTVSVREQFRCDKGADRDIFALMAKTDEVYLSYEKGLADTQEEQPEVYTVDGEKKDWPDQSASKGKVSFTILDSGNCGTIAHTQGPTVLSFAKSLRGLTLQSLPKGTAALVFKPLTELDLVQDKIENLLTETNSASKGLHIIACGRHRSFDFLQSHQLAAVVEEAVFPFSRSVICFRHGERVPYGSPVVPYQPSDVCFYKLGGRDVLLVADELNDAIHIVDVQTGKFLFFLAPGDPHVIQPTALNVDTRGRLWVACRGGAVLLCEPL